MLPNILYFKHFNKKNANLVIVLSKLAELNTITLPFEFSKILKKLLKWGMVISLKIQESKLQYYILKIMEMVLLLILHYLFKIMKKSTRYI